jgi:hypothetical protein
VVTKFDTSTIRCFVLVDEQSGVAFPELARRASSDASRRALEDLAGSLLRRTKDWARELSGAEPEVLELPRDADRLAAAEGTVVLLRPALVRLSPEQSGDLIDDLQAGCNVIFGPTLAGGWYLLALNPANPDLIEAAGSGTPGSAGRLLAAARHHEGIEGGMLRAERDLNADSDLRAAAADPLVDIELSRLLADVVTGS